MMLRRLKLAGPLLSSLCVLLSGCGGSATTPPATPVTPTASVPGTVHAGQHVVSGASVSLYAVGMTGNGSVAQNLLASSSITTDGTGAFKLPESYTCPADTTQVYAVARGGNPGLASGTNNGALVLVSAVGDCKSLSGLSSISINEATTAAAAWALAQFAGSSANVGATSTNLTGVRNAFHIAANLISVTTGAPPASLPAGAFVEADKVNSLSNALASCAYSDGGTNCQPLLTAATVGGIRPANTFDAALAVVRNPGTNVGAVYTASLTQTPYGPALSVAPKDWTLSFTYGKCSSNCGGLSSPGDVAIDASGDVWVANYNGGVVSEFSPTGTPVAAQGFPGTGLRQSYGISIDAQNNVWIANQQSVTAANNGHNGSISKFSSSGTELSGGGYTGGGIYFPQAVAAGSDGHIWAANYGASSATLLANDGSAISGSGGYAASAIPFVSAVGLDAAHNAWFAAQGVAVRVTQAGVVNSYACCNYPTGVAVDPSGNVWLADYSGSSIVELSATGAPLRNVSTAAGNTAPQGIAIDAAGNIWTSNYYGDSITKILGATGALASPAAGLGLDAGLSEPYGIAIDASGNLWISNAASSTVTQFVGLAAPVQTPLLGPPALP
jgi:streptogramin lyase